MNLPQDNEPLRKYAIKAWINTDDAQQVEMEVVQLTIAEKVLVAEQTRLKADLIAKVRKMLPEKREYLQPRNPAEVDNAAFNALTGGFNAAIDQITAQLTTVPDLSSEHETLRELGPVTSHNIQREIRQGIVDALRILPTKFMRENNEAYWQAVYELEALFTTERNNALITELERLPRYGKTRGMDYVYTSDIQDRIAELKSLSAEK